MVSVLLADIPWSFDNRRTGGSLRSGASQVYPTMPLSDAMALGMWLPLCADAVCYLWVPTTLKFSHGGPVLAAWGFTYKTTLYWEKTGRLGLGFWYRNQVEELLVGVRGAVRPFRMADRNTHHEAARRHSSKPAYYHRLIERSTDGMPGRRVELFGRVPVRGWTVLGDAVTGEDVRVSLARMTRAVSVASH